MALDMTNAKTKQVMSKSEDESSKDLKLMLSENQLTKATSIYYNIRKAFYDNHIPMTRHDEELAELIRLKILDTILVEDF